MKNAHIYPFERNNYFYGKLLTTRDFNLEQLYFNNKRRLLSNLLHGCGVICGLNVDAVDDTTICIKSGAAIDGRGREIIIPTVVTKKVCDFDGFKNNSCSKNVYLCLEYDEKGKKPVHDLTTMESSKFEYNRTIEKYRLFISESIPNLSRINYNQLINNIEKIYYDSKIKIWLITPKYVLQNGNIEGKIIIEKPSKLQNFKIKLKAKLNNLWSEKNTDNIEITYIEDEKDLKTDIELTFNIKAVGTAGTKANIRIGQRECKIFVDNQLLKLNSDICETVKIVDNSIKEKIVSDYFKRSLNQCLSGFGDVIYLARIDLIHVGTSYNIDKIKKIPFNQYIYNQSFLNILNQQIDESIEEVVKPLTSKVNVMSLIPGEEPRADVKYNQAKNELKFNFGIPKPKVENNGLQQMISGVVEIKLGEQPKVNRCFYSDIINHGLGVGCVCIMMAIEEKFNNNSMLELESDQLLFGELDVFEESNYVTQIPNVSLGAVLYKKQGNFKIGLKLKSPTKLKKIPVRWWAYKTKEEVLKNKDIGQKQIKDEICISIEPDTVQLKRGEQIQLKAEVKHTDNKNVTWRIVESDGGKITQKGLYTAPNARGVYKIEATSIADFSKTAMVFVVVKN